MPSFSGAEWNEFTRSAMSQKFGAGWQTVPDRTRGDWGIEGFVRPDGLLLQSYATEKRTPQERSSAQKGKLTSDIRKLQKNADHIRETIGDLVITCYVFLVPNCDDKAVVAHAESQAALVRGWEFDWIHDDFYVTVQDFDYVAAEWETLHGAVSPIRLAQLQLQSDFALSDVVHNSGLLSNLERKLKASPSLGTNDEKRHEWERRLVGHHARAEHLKSQLGQTAPELADRVQSVRDSYESRLVRREFAPEPVADLVALGDGLRESIRLDVRALSHADADELAFGAVADWLMRCPLEYVGASS